MCSLGIEPTTFALLTQCSTTEPQEHVNIWRTFLFQKSFFVVKEGTSDYKKVRRRFFKEPLTEWFSVEPKMVFYGIAVKNLLSTFIFKSVLIKYM